MIYVLKESDDLFLKLFVLILYYVNEIDEVMYLFIYSFLVLFQ